MDLPKLLKAIGPNRTLLLNSDLTSHTTILLYWPQASHHLCLQAKLVSIPTSDTTLLLFVSHLTTQNLAYATIKIYLAAVCGSHVAARKHNTFQSQLMPRLHQVMKGICKLTAISKPPRVHLPITIDIMQGIHTALSNEPDTHSNKMMWTVRCMVFFGFFYTQATLWYPPNITMTPKPTHLSLSDVTLDRRPSPTTLRIHI